MARSTIRSDIKKLLINAGYSEAVYTRSIWGVVHYETSGFIIKQEVSMGRPMITIYIPTDDGMSEITDKPCKYYGKNELPLIKKLLLDNGYVSEGRIDPNSFIIYISKDYPHMNPFDTKPIPKKEELSLKEFNGSWILYKGKKDLTVKQIAEELDETEGDIYLLLRAHNIFFPQTSTRDIVFYYEEHGKEFVDILNSRYMMKQITQ